VFLFVMLMFDLDLCVYCRCVERSISQLCLNQLFS
jgi:hypothetical protein